MITIRKGLINMFVICSLGACAQTTPPKPATKPTVADESQATAGPSVVAMITEHFPEEKEVMKAISWCESGLIHRENGALLRNRGGGSALGTFQVLMRVHRAEMERMNLDPDDDDEYMAYVKHIVHTQGLSAWNPSRHCWASHST